LSKQENHTTKQFKFVSPALFLAFGCAILPVGISLAQSNSLEAQARFGVPRPDHIVIVIEENKSYERIIGNRAAQYINHLANEGALFTQSFGIAHPSQPNYLALFSGSTHGVPGNRCLRTLTGENLASELRREGITFGIYSESMPSVGYTGCDFGHYRRKHNPVVNWQGVNIPPEMNMPFSMFPTDYSKLPTVSIVVPNQLNDMHDGQTLDAIIRGDGWLKQHLDSYVQWAKTNNSLLIVTWDEDDGSSNNHIPTIFAGPMVTRGRYSSRIDHYIVLRTIIDMYGLVPPGRSADVKPIFEVWKRAK
jgi:acid phosphatase